MKYVAPFGVLAALAVTAASCGSDFSHVPSGEQVVAKLMTGANVGSASQPLAISFVQTSDFTFHIEAQLPDGTVDRGFNGYLRASVKPGTVASVTGPNTEGRNVKLVGGIADGVTVSIVAAYGPSRIWFDDEGYLPADPARTPPPQCADGVDNNGNGLVDFPADPGCAYANDDTEDGGTLATGTSDVIYFATPRVADVRGITQGGAGTPFPYDQVSMDTGWRGGANYAFSTIVTNVAADGFFVTDLQDDQSNPAGYSSVYAYTYSTPPFMYICDRLRVFGGTASDFFGFTEMNYPTWELEEWNPTQRPCGIPEPTQISVSDYGTSAILFKHESGLVRVGGVPATTMHVTSKFGPGYPSKANGFAPTADATNCDFDKNGKISFTGGDEQACYTVCYGGVPPGSPAGTMALPDDPECTEYSGFGSQGNFNLVVSENGGAPVKVNVNGAADATFDPLVLRGQPVTSWTGNLRYFSGGAQWTINARCADDIITDPMGAPLSSEKACVHARTITNNPDQVQ